MDQKNTFRLIVPMGGTGTAKPLEIDQKCGEDSKIKIVTVPAKDPPKDSF